MSRSTVALAALVAAFAASARADDWSASLRIAPRWMRAVVEPDQTTTTLEGTPAGVVFSAARRFGWLESGLLVDSAIGATAFHLLAGGELGVAVPIGSARLEILGQAGAHLYHVEGCGWSCILSRETADSTVLPFVGGRVAIGWPVAPHLRLGGGAFAHTDLGHGGLTQTLTTCLFGCSSETLHYRVGGWEAGPDVSLALEF